MDDFESGSLDQWWLGQLAEGGYWIDHDVVRQGSGALAIRVDEGNLACGANCQRNEIRLVDRLRLPFGTDAWYAFSFRVEGDIVPRGSIRWVIGQWKQENGRSPFLAQRLDNGVFHITIQDEGCRLTIASASGDPDGMPTNRGTGPDRPFQSLGESGHTRCASDVVLEWGAFPVLPDPVGAWVDMIYHVVGGLDGDGLVEVWADGRFIVRATGSIGFDNAAGPGQYFKFGIYRNTLPGAATVYIDNFRRGGSLLDIAPEGVMP